MDGLLVSACNSEASTVTHEVSALIQARLDAFVDSDQDSEVLSAELASVCGRYPEAPWEVLALIDQYHRRGRLTTETFQAVKSDTHKFIFGPPQADETPRFPMTAEASEAVPESGSPPRNPPPALLAPGAVLCDRYVIEAPLGRGGSGTVFRALDRHRLNLPPEDHRVAIKIVRDEFSADPEAVRALQEEFCLAQSLSHPNIVNVFDLGRDGERYFITMELLEGEMLGAMMRRMRPQLLPLADAFWIIREVGAALQYAHERGIVHADLSPGNILLTHAGRVCLLDFGIAIRTPAAAQRDDIHDLACIAYQLLSGRRPPGKRPRRIRVLTARQWRALRAALAPDRERRPQSMHEWLVDFKLQRAQGDSRTRSMEAGGRQRRPATWLAAGIAAVACTLAFLSTSETDPLRKLPMAVAARRIASDLLEASASPAPSPEVSAAKAAPSPVATQAAAGQENADTTEVAADAEIGAAPGKTARARDGAALPAMHGPGVLYFDRQSYRIGEGGMAARLTVRRVAGSDGEVAFQWRTIASSARSGDDFASFDAATERLGPGQDTAVIYVPIVSDILAEDTEQFEVEIDRTGGGASLGPVTRATVIIEDDD